MTRTAPAGNVNQPQPEVTVYVICVGNPFDGMRIVGDRNGQPFPDGNEASEYAGEALHGREWWLVKIDPSDYGETT